MVVGRRGQTEGLARDPYRLMGSPRRDVRTGGLVTFVVVDVLCRWNRAFHFHFVSSIDLSKTNNRGEFARWVRSSREDHEDERGDEVARRRRETFAAALPPFVSAGIIFAKATVKDPLLERRLNRGTNKNNGRPLKRVIRESSLKGSAEHGGALVAAAFASAIRWRRRCSREPFPRWGPDF